MGSNLFGIGFGELLFLAILALIVFGPKRIPEVARTIGRLARQFRQAAGEAEKEVRQLIDEVQPPGGQGGSVRLPELPRSLDDLLRMAAPPEPGRAPEPVPLSPTAREAAGRPESPAAQPADPATIEGGAPPVPPA